MKQVNIRNPFRMLVLLLGLFLSVGAFAQIDVKGHVKDDLGEPVIGATVRVVGTQTATVTDFDGNFALKANQGADISVSYVGYQTATVKAAADLVITLREDANVLDNVVVIGYGTVKKSDLTGSVAALKPDGKNKGVVVNAQDMLSGKVAGVSVISNSGEPGAGSQIRIRGGSSLSASNDPLIVIDGLAIDNSGVAGSPNILSTINPQDIESFNILKDASATAIYGSRGSNGVIIITTKKGRKGAQAPQISYAGSLTISKNKKTLDVMDGDQFRSYIEGLYGTDHDAYRALGTANTDWQDLIYRTAVSHDHNVTVSGAVKNLPYRVSVGYTDQQGTIKTSDYKRVTAAFNLNPSLLNDHLTINLNAKGSYSRAQYANTGAVGAAISMDPTQDPYSFTSVYSKNMLGADLERTLNNFNGYYQWTGPASYNDSTWPFTKFKDATSNPLSLLNEQSEIAHSRSFIGSAEFDYKVHGFEDLRLHMTLGIDISKGRQHTNMEQSSPGSAGSIYYGKSGYWEKTKRNTTFNAYAQYYKDFNKDHHFDIMVGYEWQRFWSSEKTDKPRYYPMTNNNVSLRGTQYDYEFADDNKVYKTEHYLVSFFGRMNYTLMDRYMLTFTLRDDGSSRFADHWAVFPSLALAWKIKNESFLKDVDALSDLKLRLGWGKTGQQDGVSDYGWVHTYDISVGTNGLYPIAGLDGVLYRPGNYTDKLKWETTTTYNVGLDFGFLNQRLTASVDYYYRKTTDLLNYAKAPAMSGYKNMMWQNIGSLKNTGIEASISWKPVVTKDFFWQLDYNITYNKNEITDLEGVSDNGKPVETGPNAGGGTGNYVQAHQVGYPASSFYVYQQVYDADGMPIENCVVDRNGDGVITPDDRYLYKSPAAPVTMGFASRFEYKNFDFSFSLRASFDNYVFNDVLRGSSNVGPTGAWVQSAYMGNHLTDALERNWQTWELTANQSDYYVQNASFLKCDNITLGYSFSDLFKSAKYHGLSGRFSVAASNVFTITKYKGLDPEITNGVDQNMYPRPFSIVVGLNLNF
ncbi:MAG: TonB-dependent receptor [Prevotella sp.]|nr:TonB-dependent receptor [Prevotella sp.]